MGRIWAAKIADSDDVALFINGPESTGTNFRSGLNMWPNGDVYLSSGDGASELTLYKSGDASIAAGNAASIILESDGDINVTGSVSLTGSIDSSLTVNDNVTINGDLTVDADNNINLASDYEVTIGDTDAKIVKLSDGTVYMQSSGDASVYVTDDGDTEIRSDGGAASIILKSDGDILISGNIKDNRILQATSALPIPSAGSTATGYIIGLTSDHQLVRWNFSSSAENVPPADLDWETYDGYFTITNNGGTTSESITPVFFLPQ
jgi:hypothetical protein